MEDSHHREREERKKKTNRIVWLTPPRLVRFGIVFDQWGGGGAQGFNTRADVMKETVLVNEKGYDGGTEHTEEHAQDRGRADHSVAAIGSKKVRVRVHVPHDPFLLDYMLALTEEHGVRIGEIYGTVHTSKELTEAGAALRHATNFEVDGGETVRCYVVGEGKNPTVSLLLRKLTEWDIVSIDPILAGGSGVRDGGTYVADFDYNVDVESDRARFDAVVVIGVHSHNDMDAFYRRVAVDKSLRRDTVLREDPHTRSGARFPLSRYPESLQSGRHLQWGIQADPREARRRLVGASGEPRAETRVPPREKPSRRRRKGYDGALSFWLLGPLVAILGAPSWIDVRGPVLLHIFVVHCDILRVIFARTSLLCLLGEGGNVLVVRLVTTSPMPFWLVRMPSVVQHVNHSAHLFASARIHHTGDGQRPVL